VSTPWLFAGAPDVVDPGQAVLMEGTTFCIGDQVGDLPVQGPSGLFVRDTRMLCRWQLAMAGRRLQPLRVHQDSPHSATFLVLALPAPGAADRPGNDPLVVRDRFIGDGMREDITVRNTASYAVEVDLELRVDADFADLFEVKDGRVGAVAPRTTSLREHAIDLSLVRDGEEFGVSVEGDESAEAGPGGLRWRATVAPRTAWTTTVLVVPRLRGRVLRPHHGPGTAPEHAEPARRRTSFRGNAPVLRTPDRALADVLGTSIEDLATLRIFDPDHPDVPVIAAGAPWFMALFGRDSLLTSMMLLPIDASLALGTLTTLGAHQGRRVDEVTEEQPGRILHELRFGPAGTLALGGGSAYYGSADATALFVMAVGALHDWHPSLVGPDLVRHVDRALEWMDTLGDPDGDGFVEYSRSTGGGLLHQGWKDSWDGINFADGSPAEPPIALAEVQAYAYGAHLARARIADASEDAETAARWRARAAYLKEAFDEQFWLPQRGWYAVGLDRHKRPIDALTSNIGHCLWTGLAHDARAAQVADHLVSPRMFTGWGIRTLASDMGAYDPLSYHNGSVWPHDTALCAAGLARYGHGDAARRVAVGLLDAAEHFGHRLPELFGGFAREDVPVPVPYPAACSPQAWAAAAPVELLRTLLGLEPADGRPRCAPLLPERFLPLAVCDLSSRGGRYDVEVDVEGAARVSDAASG
jgi:glycogen debranching enzyme